MNSLGRLLKRQILSVALLVLLVVASFGLLNLAVLPQAVYAAETKVSITNGSFNSFSQSSTYPYTPSSYTNKGNNTPSLKSGSINISESTYRDRYDDYGVEEYGLGEYDNPKSTGSDNYILMIASQEDCGYGYISNQFKLNANGHYYITVSVQTVGDDGIASIYLLENDKIFKDYKIENISTGSTWRDYTFFVSTSGYESLNLNFAMYLGGKSGNVAKGCVFFDELRCAQISKETLDTRLKNYDDRTYVYNDLYTSHLYKKYEFGKTPNYFATNETGLADTNAYITYNALNLSATNSYVLYKGEEETLQPNTTYKFSINAKVSSALSSGSAFVRLDEILDEEEETYKDPMGDDETSITAKNGNLSISSVTTNTITDGFVQYSIYVRTGALKDSKVQFSFGLGSKSANATGSISFKDFTIERVPYSVYSSASTGSTIAKMDISERISLSSKTFANYTFDKMTSENDNGTQYPAKATDWTHSASGEGEQLSGVVNLSKFDEVMSKYSSKVNVIGTPVSLTSSANNNVLMIYNGYASKQSYTSNSYTLSANKYYKITAFVNTVIWEDDSTGATLVVKTKQNDQEYVLAKATNIKTVNNWKRVDFIIHTPSNSVEVYLELALGYGNLPASGYAFFDNIMIDEQDSKDALTTRFNNIPSALDAVDVDLVDSMQSATNSRDYNQALLYVGKNNNTASVNAGIVNLTNDLSGVVPSSSMEEFRKLGGDVRKLLAISSAINEDVYYTYTSLLPYNFEGGKYYKLSFEAFTLRLGQTEEKYDNDVLAQGANVSLTGLENASFKYINSNGVWTTYEFYIGVNDSCTSNLVFSLGTENAGCYGSAFIGNIKLAEVTETDFDAKSAGETVQKVDTIITTDNSTEDTDQNPTGNNFSLQYLPAIATFLALALAVIVVIVRRKFKFKKPVKAGAINYDRDNTVLQNKYRRQAMETRDREVRELTKECERLVNERTECEAKYKDAMARLRTAKLNNRDGLKKHEISATEREIKHISKEVSRYGVQLNNYHSELELMKTEGYLQDLERRLMRQHNANSRINLMDEDERKIALDKQLAKQEKQANKEKAEIEKLEKQQQALAQKHEAIEQELNQAIAKDEENAKQEELRKIEAEQARLAKLQKQEEERLRREREKAEKLAEKERIEAEKLAEQKAEEIVEETQQSEEKAEEITQEQPAEENVETVEEKTETSAENDAENVEGNTAVEAENNAENKAESVSDVQEEKGAEEPVTQVTEETNNQAE